MSSCTLFAKVLSCSSDTDAARAVLLSDGGLKNSTDEQGVTLGMYAAGRNDVSLLRLIYEEFGADLNKRCEAQGIWSGALPLHFASDAGHTDVIRTLITEFGVDPTTPTHPLRYGVRAGAWTPVHFAASEGHVDAIHVLVEEGVDLTEAKDERGRTAMYTAVCNGHSNAVRTLSELGLSVNDDYYVNHAAEYGHVDVLHTLAELGADLFAREPVCNQNAVCLSNCDGT